MIRRFGTPPEAGKRYKNRPGAYVILLRGKEILLTRQYRPKTMNAPEYQLPGGGIDPGESSIPALHREVYEETGWHMSAPRRLGAFRRFKFMPEYSLWAEKICTIYVARPTLCLGAPPEHGHSAVWLPAHAAIEILYAEADKIFTKRYLASKGLL